MELEVLVFPACFLSPAPHLELIHEQPCILPYLAKPKLLPKHLPLVSLGHISDLPFPDISSWTLSLHYLNQA